MESRHLVVMMTDIQGFTRATSGMGREQVEELLALHEDLLVPVLKEFGGTIVKGLGDAFLVTFEAPTAAVKAGIRIQEVLQEHNQGSEEGRQLKVRVALNAGEVNIRDQDVFGEAVNITARVESVSAADHVTLTEAVYLLMDRDGVKTEFLEEVELKGIPFPVKLYRVIPDWISEGESPSPAAQARETEAGLSRKMRWSLAGGATLLLGLILGGVFGFQPPPAELVQTLLAAGKVEEAILQLERSQKERPSPELTAAGVKLLRSRLEEFRKQEAWQEARTLLERFSRLSPPLPVAFPEEMRRLSLEAIAAYRRGENWPQAEPLFEEVLSQGDPGAEREKLATWAEEDLVRVWEETIAPKLALEDFARKINAEELIRLSKRLEALDPTSPWLNYVQGIRTALSLTAVALRRREGVYLDEVKELATALSVHPDLGEREELEPIVEILLSSFPPPSKPGEKVWSWADQFLTQRVGVWVEKPLKAWCHRIPPPEASASIRLSNQYLRRNSARILALRGHPPQLDLLQLARADLELLALRSELVEAKVQLAEVESLAARFKTLPAPDQKSLEASFRAYLESALEKDDESFSWRETHTRVACELGWETACVPGRELYRDLRYYLETQLASWNFKDSEWFRNSVSKSLEAVPGSLDPWRSSLRKLLEKAQPRVEKASPKLLPNLVAALEKLG